MPARPPRAPRRAPARFASRFAGATAAAVVLTALTLGAGAAHAAPTPADPPGATAGPASASADSTAPNAPADEALAPAPAPTDEVPAPAPSDGAPAPAEEAPAPAAPMATTTILDVPSRLEYGDLLIFEITVTDANGRPASGSVSPTVAGVDTVGPDILLENGHATYVFGGPEGDGPRDPANSAVLDLGTYPLEVAFTPSDPALLAPSGTTAAVAVVPRATRVEIAWGDDIRQRTRTDWGYNLAARVIDGLPLDESPARYAVSGTVDFSVGGVFAGTAEVRDGWAFLPTTWPVAGEYEITAVYSGDSRYLGSTSDPWTLQVLPAPAADSGVPTGLAGDGTTALAETGAMDAAPPLLVATAAVLGGALLVAVRRRRRLAR